MTPAEFDAVATARSRHQRLNWEVMDNMNALLCATVARCAGNRDATPAHFETIRRETEEKKIKDTSPEGIVEYLKLLTVALGGTLEKKQNG